MQQNITIELGELREDILKQLVSSGIISQQGLIVNGNGVIMNKLDTLIDCVKKTNNALYHLESKVESVMAHQGIVVKI